MFCFYNAISNRYFATNYTIFATTYDNEGVLPDNIVLLTGKNWRHQSSWKVLELYFRFLKNFFPFLPFSLFHYIDLYCSLDCFLIIIFNDKKAVALDCTASIWVPLFAKVSAFSFASIAVRNDLESIGVLSFFLALFLVLSIYHVSNYFFNLGWRNFIHVNNKFLWRLGSQMR